MFSVILKYLIFEKSGICIIDLNINIRFLLCFLHCVLCKNIRIRIGNVCNLQLHYAVLTLLSELAKILNVLYIFSSS